MFPDVCPLASSDCVWPRKPALTNAPKGLRHGVAPWVLARVRRWVHAGVCPWVVLAYLLPRMTALASTPKSIRLGVSPGVPAGACPWVFAAANAPAVQQSPLFFSLEHRSRAFLMPRPKPAVTCCDVGPLLELRHPTCLRPPVQLRVPLLAAQRPALNQRWYPTIGPDMSAPQTKKTPPDNHAQVVRSPSLVDLHTKIPPSTQSTR